MKLPFLPKAFSPSQPREYLFAVNIDTQSVKTAVWSVANNKVQILAVGPTSDWDAQTPESLVSACDNSLSECLKKLDPSGKIQPEKIILGLPTDWVESEKIIPDRLKLLKHLSSELSLKAVGFVITPQALIRYLQRQEGVPSTAILVGIHPDILEIFLIRLGKINSTEIVHRSGNVGHDVAEGLSRLRSENMLPSRMLLFGQGQNLENPRQEILTFPWQSPQYKLPFLHFPKVEILPDDFSIQAISEAGGSEVAQAIGLLAPSSPDQSPVSGSDPATSPQDLGFFPGVDIAVAAAPAVSAVIPASLPDPSPVSSPRSPRVNLPRVSFHLSFPKLSRATYLTVPLVTICLALLGWFIWFKLSAQVTLTLIPQTQEYDLEFTADPDISQLNSDSGLLPATAVSATVSASKSKSTTGSKIIGDKAVGEVTIINGTPVTRLFPAGTVLVSPSGLKFSLDASVEVASASGTADPNSYQPGKVLAKITAAEIGSDGNLSAGTQFRIGSFSSLDYIAKNDIALTGGSSKQVQAVSKQDITDLKSELFASLPETAKTQLLASQESSRIIIPDSITVKTETESLDHQVDEAVDTLTLDLTMKASGISLLSSDLDQLVSDRISSEIPTDLYQYKPVDYEFGIKNFSGSKAQVVVNATTHLLPKIDYEQVKSQISGQSFSQAKKYLESLKGVSGVNLDTLPKIFSWFGILPHVKQNIHFVTNPS